MIEVKDRECDREREHREREREREMAMADLRDAMICASRERSLLVGNHDHDCSFRKWLKDVIVKLNLGTNAGFLLGF
jgi:hypothetical protein